MRMRRSSRQCRMSASHDSCSVSLHCFEPDSHRSFAADKHSGTGICCSLGEKRESCAPERMLERIGAMMIRTISDFMATYSTNSVNLGVKLSQGHFLPSIHQLL